MHRTRPPCARRTSISWWPGSRIVSPGSVPWRWPVPQPYEWAALRVVPRVERSEFVNAGVIVYCHATSFLAARAVLPEALVRALDPDLDLEVVRGHLEAVVALCAGDPSTAPNANRSAGERFRWLVEPRSTV